MSTSWLDHLTGTARELGQGLLHLVYPGCCFLCGRPLPPGEARFCAMCRAALLTDPFPSCPRCGATVGPFAVIDGRCASCRQESYPFERTLRLGPYAGVLREAVLKLKHQSGEGLAELLGAEWAGHAGESFRGLGADVLVPVPLFWWRRLHRGYNQSAALAYGLSRRLGLPCQSWWLRRIRHTPFQTRQSLAGRRENVRGAFAVRRGVRLQGRNILLVDDVMTTGATAAEAARALRDAGAARVVVAVLARGHG